MGVNLIGFLAFSFVGMTLINRMIEAAWITGSDIAVINQLAFTRTFTFLNVIPVPVLNLDFFYGLIHLAKWDYSFFGGNAAIIQFLLYSFTAAMTFVLFVLLIGSLFNLATRLGR